MVRFNGSYLKFSERNFFLVTMHYDCCIYNTENHYQELICPTSVIRLVSLYAFVLKATERTFVDSVIFVTLAFDLN